MIKLGSYLKHIAKPNSAYQRSLNVEKDIANGKLNQAEVKIKQTHYRLSKEL